MPFRRRRLIQRSIPLRRLEALLFSPRRLEGALNRPGLIRGWRRWILLPRSLRGGGGVFVSDRTRGRSSPVRSDSTPAQRGTVYIVPILGLRNSLFHPPELFFKRMGVLDDWLRLLLAA
jgi:hypothetical protein